MSVYVTVSILKLGKLNNLTTKLVLYLHITQIVEDFMTFPFLLTWNSEICSLGGWLHIYSQLSNQVCITILIAAYRHMFFEDKFGITKFTTKWSATLIYGVPLISLLPFMSGSYGEIHNGLCSFVGNDSNLNYFWQGGFYIWTCLIVIGCLFMFFKTVKDVYQADKQLGLLN
jgi:hypothetical protein